MPHFGISIILLVGAALRLWRLGDTGFITPYYLAGVRSLMGNWHNFFFNSFDPAGFVSLDKPPVAFWLQTISAEILGFSPFSALLPQALAGVAAIALLYFLVQRSFGRAAGLLAALFLALAPVVVAVDRSNNTESCLILVLLLAASALLRAIETQRLSYLILSAALVGVGFNTKMLVAFGIVPVAFFLYLAAAPFRWPRRIAHLAAAGVVLLAVSLSWSLVYELTPPQDRPYADSTQGNSMLELAVEHNALQRFVSVHARPAPAPRPAPNEAVQAQGRDFAPAGPLRLAAPRLAAQANWLLPFAIIGSVAAWFCARDAGAAAAQRRMLALWAGWALIYGVVFSAAGGLFHAYYVAVLAPAFCALAGIGAATLFSLYGSTSAARLLLPATIIGTALWQWHIVNGYGQDLSLLIAEWAGPSVVGLSGVTAAALIAFHHHRAGAWIAAGGVALLLVFPAAWSIGTANANGIAGFPGARPPFLSETATMQRWRFSQVAGALSGDPRLLSFLHDQRRGEKFLLATVNARQAAPIIIATGEPVMALGGFSGGDPILTVEHFAHLVVQQNRVRFALIGDGSPGLRRIFGENRQRPLIDWIRQNGRPVDPTLWRSATGPVELPRGGRRMHAAETADSELYDLRPENSATAQ